MLFCTNLITAKCEVNEMKEEPLTLRTKQQTDFSYDVWFTFRKEHYQL